MEAEPLLITTMRPRFRIRDFASTRRGGSRSLSGNCTLFPCYPARKTTGRSLSGHLYATFPTSKGFLYLSRIARQSDGHRRSATSVYTYIPDGRMSP